MYKLWFTDERRKGFRSLGIRREVYLISTFLSLETNNKTKTNSTGKKTRCIRTKGLSYQPYMKVLFYKSWRKLTKFRVEVPLWNIRVLVFFLSFFFTLIFCPSSGLWWVAKSDFIKLLSNKVRSEQVWET